MKLQNSRQVRHQYNIMQHNNQHTGRRYAHGGRRFVTETVGLFLRIDLLRTRRKSLSGWQAIRESTCNTDDNGEACLLERCPLEAKLLERNVELQVVSVASSCPSYLKKEKERTFCVGIFETPALTGHVKLAIIATLRN